MIASPTGSGKSLILNGLRKELTGGATQVPGGAVVLAPSMDILKGLFAKAEPNWWAVLDGKNENSTQRPRMESLGFYTTLRYHNLLMSAAVNPPMVVLSDECFPVGTLVDGRPIETLKVGDYVTSHSGPRRVAHVFDRPAPDRLVTVRCGGREVTSTPNHPFKTQRGWVNAESLCRSDSVLLGVCPAVRGVQTPTEQVPSRQSGVLLGEMSIDEFVTDYVEDELCVCVGPDESAQPDAVGVGAGQGVRHAEGHGVQARVAGRERARHGVRSALECGHGVEFRRGADEGGEVFRMAGALQVGLAQPGGKVGGGNRRPLARGAKGEGRGPEEGRLADWARVDGVTIHERSSSPDFARLCPNDRVYNLEVEGDPTYFANGLGVHNCHHSVSETQVVLRALAGNPPMVGVTATPYRGTAEETRKLRDLWGPPYVALSLKAAVERSVVARPDFSVWPLVDDETIAVSNGEFVTTAVETALEGVYDDVAARFARLPRRPTMIRCPGVASAKRMAEALESLGERAWCIVGESTAAERAEAFAEAAAGTATLVQVKVVGEGVDLPLRRLIDLAPTMSPVAWMQAVGRITRPTAGDRPEYVTTNHNLTRHAYLWEGLIPPSQVAAAQRAWGPDFKPSRRSLARALGLEGFGKFTVSPVPMVDGSAGSLYSLQTKDGLNQYAVFLHPCMPEPLYFARANALTGRTITTAGGFACAEKAYGKWRRAEAVPPAEGYVSVRSRPMSERMQATWEDLADRRGFDGKAAIDGRQYEALFMFLHTKSVYRP